MKWVNHERTEAKKTGKRKTQMRKCVRTRKSNYLIK